MQCELRRLTADDLQELMGLFAACFQDDSYYRALFSGNVAAEIKKNFTPVLAYHLANGSAVGAFSDGRLVGFVIGFDYYQLRSENRDMFRQTFFADKKTAGELLQAETSLHQWIKAMDTLGSRLIYLLALGVSQECRRQGIGRALVERMMADWEGCCFASDVSSSVSLHLLCNMGFEKVQLMDGYWYVQRKAEQETPVLGDSIAVAFPTLALIRELFGTELAAEPMELNNHTIVIGGEVEYFKNVKGEHCTAYVAQLSYQQLLEYQRWLNLAHQEETWTDSERWGTVLFYRLMFPYDEGPLLWNDTLREMVKFRTQEWSTIGDLYAMFPVEQTGTEQLVKTSVAYDPQMEEFLHYLNYRTWYETGVPAVEKKQVDAMFDFKTRIRRLHLGKLKVQITQELSADQYLKQGAVEGQPAYVDLVLSIDNKSRCGVLTMVSLSLPFLLSHYMDNIIRNQLMVRSSSGDWVNFYEYIYEAFGLLKRGSPKIFAVIPQEKSCLSEQQIASLLMGETIYASNEALGGFCDEGVMSVIRSEHGMGQYDRGFVCADSNVLLQFGTGARGLVCQRLCEAAITCFYMELILLEESAIQIADAAIVEFLTAKRKRSMIRFLKRTYQIYEGYSDTIAFWDVQVNYPSSRRSITMLREAFGIQQLLDRLERDRGQLQSMFDTRRDIMDRTEAVILNYIMLFLALMQGVAIAFPTLFSEARTLPLGGTVVLIMMLIYSGFKRLASRSWRKK